MGNKQHTEDARRWQILWIWVFLKQNKREEGCRVAVLNKVVRRGLLEEAALEQKYERRGMSWPGRYLQDQTAKGCTGNAGE